MAETLTDRDLSIEEYGKRAFLRPQQRQELELSVASIQKRLADPVVLELTGGDAGALEKQLHREQQILARGTPPPLTESQTKKMVNKLKKCEDLITNGMPTYSMMERGRPSDVDHHVAHENARWQDEDGSYTTKRAILARQNYLLTLAPHSIEPNLLSMTVLRTDTVRGDPAKFRTNWDHIRWRQTMEEEIAAVIGDDEYLLFGGLKALGWSEATIRRKLDWPQSTYDLAMERWRQDPDMHPQAGGAADGPIAAADPALTSLAQAPEDTPSLPTTPPSPGGTPAVPFVERITVAEQWPRDELEAMGVSLTKFLKQCQFSHGSYTRWTQQGQWPVERYETAKAALAELRRTHGLEPDGSEPGPV